MVMPLYQMLVPIRLDVNLPRRVRGTTLATQVINTLSPIVNVITNFIPPIVAEIVIVIRTHRNRARLPTQNTVLRVSKKTLLTKRVHVSAPIPPDALSVLWESTTERTTGVRNAPRIPGS